MDQREKMGQFFRQVRKDLNLSQQEVADRANVTQKTISRIESGKDNASLQSVFAIGEVLDVEIHFRKKKK